MVRLQRPVDQLCIVSVLGEQAGELTERLTRDGFQITEINSSGGLLQELQVSLLIGLNHERRVQLLERRLPARSFSATRTSAPSRISGARCSASGANCAT